MLAYMEQVLGYANMQDFITYYIYNNAYTSIDAYTMRQTFSDFCDTFFADPTRYTSSIVPDQMMYEINFNDWMYNVGPDPTGTLNFTTSQTAAAVQLANAYLAGG